MPPMGRWRALGAFLGAPFAQARRRETFDSPPQPIDQVILDFAGGGGSLPRASRSEALAVPGILRGRNLICSIATLPLIQHDRDFHVIESTFLNQIDPDVANVVTLAQTLEDLLFEAISWWRITAFGWDNFPFYAKHVDVNLVSLDPPTSRDNGIGPLPSDRDPRGIPFVWVGAERVPADEMIRFDSPNPGILKYAGRTIRRHAALDRAASMYADDPRPQDYFTPDPNADEIDDDQIKDILARWKAERKTRGTAYIPKALNYNAADSMSPVELQLAELQKQATLEVANALGVDPEDLGISTTSRTYANAVDRRRDRINDVNAPYMAAIIQRLSMNDVTKRANTVRFDLDEYLRSNPKERAEVQQIYVNIGAKGPEEIRREERIPPGAPKPRVVAPNPASDAAPAEPATQNTDLAVAQFDEDRPMYFADLPVETFRADPERRTIEGVALPYGVVVSKGGFRFRFLRNSIVWNERAPGRVKLLRDHDMTEVHGFAKSLQNAGDKFKVLFKVGRGPARDQLLTDAADGLIDGLSVGVDFDLATDVEMDDDGVMNVRRATLREVSITAMPAFDDARLTNVAASRTGVTMDECTTCGQRHAPGACPPATPPTSPPAQQPVGIQLSDEQLRALLSRPGALQALVNQPAPTPATPTAGFTLSQEQLDTLIRSGGIGVLLGLPSTPAGASSGTEPTEPRGVVDPTRRVGATAVTAVSEPLPYRFDARGNLTRGVTYDFSTDMYNASKGDGEAMDRATKFLLSQVHRFSYGPAVTFDVDKADAATLNPNVQRPDLYVDQKDFQYPIWDAMVKGTLADSTPFVLPKFNSASGLVAAHVEGVSPTPGTFTATSQTITPSPNSGRVEITREAWDQGGNPQLSGLIWRQMVKAWFESLEAGAVTLLEGLAPTVFTISTAAGDDILVGEVESYLSGLQFVRGGFTMRDFFGQIDLYKALASATDANGRKLLPRIGPVNAAGQVSDFYADLDVGGLRMRPSWALPASGSVAANSYLFDRGDVSGWATAPQRLQFEYRTEYVDVAIWGYKATACTDLTGVRRFTYDPV